MDTIDTTNIDWRAALGFAADAAPDGAAILKAFNARAHIEHPDKGGTTERWHALVAAKDAAYAWLADRNKPIRTGIVSDVNLAGTARDARWRVTHCLPPDFAIDAYLAGKIKRGWAKRLPWPALASGEPAPWRDVAIEFDAAGTPTALIAKPPFQAELATFPHAILGDDDVR